MPTTNSSNSGNSNTRIQVLNSAGKYYADQAKQYRDEVVTTIGQAEDIIDEAQEFYDETVEQIEALKITTKSDLDEIAQEAIDTVNQAVSDAESDIIAITEDIDGIQDQIETIEGQIETISSEVELAHDWAVKMDGLVDNEDYSSKYYATQAATSESNALEYKNSASTSASDASRDAGIATQKASDASGYASTAQTQAGIATQAAQAALSHVQSDWNETDSTATDYIKNKPTVPDDTIVSGWGYVKNTATATDSLTLLGKASSNIRAINIGVLSKANNSQGISIGYNAEASSGIAIGHNAKAVSYSIQLGEGSSPFANTFNVGFGSGINYCLLDASTGLIPDARLSLKTINGNSIKGEGNLTVSGLPSQTGHSGDVLTTDGTDASWNDTTEVYPVIETYISGSSWYKIYATDNTSFRWCEQGGLYYPGSTLAATDNTITFLKTFKDLNYTFTPTPMHSDAALNMYQMFEKYTLRTKTSTVLRTTSAQFGYEWVAKGYIENEV